MKSKKQIPVVNPIEYRLFIAPLYDEHTKQYGTLVVLQTMKQFSNFKYEIVVQDTKTNGSLNLGIHGLRAPQPALPGAGPAEFKRIYPELTDIRSVIVTKLEKLQNQFDVKITRKEVKVLQLPKEPFIEFVYSPQDL